MRIKLVVGNWKMNPASLDEVKRLMRNFQFFRQRRIRLGRTIFNFQKTQIIICPPYVYLPFISEKLKAKSLKQKAALGAQDVFYESEGAFTGEISPLMLKNLGVKYVIVGHSERRALGETNEIVRKKIGACLKHVITPIVCVGESKRDESGNYLSFVKTQLEEIFSGLPKTISGKIIIAYEPIWAIGKTAAREATPEEAEEMSIFIKKVLSDIFDAKAVKNLRIIYGGSVNPENSASFLNQRNIDGLLVGRDSLDPDNFKEIIKSVN